MQNCQDAILQGLSDNWTLTEVELSENIVDEKHHGHLLYYTLHNKFEDFVYAQDQHFGSSSESGSDDASWSRTTIPGGLWSHILVVVADKQCSSKVSVLYHLLSSRPDLLAARTDSNDVMSNTEIQSTSRQCPAK
jgi:hypothetical protein